MSDNFNIRKFLTENKLTLVSQRLNEADSYGMPGSTVVKEKKSGGSAPKASKASEPKDEIEEGEEGTGEVDTVFESFKELSKEQQLEVAKHIAKHLKPKKKKVEEEDQMEEELVGGQKKLDKDGDGEISGDDFKLMKKEK